jgi:hypothetical protein
MQKCHKGVVANDRAKAVKEHVKQGSTLEKYLNHGGQFMTSDRDLPTDRYVRGSYFRAMITSVNSHVPPLGRANVTSLIKDTSEFLKQTLILAFIGMYCALTTDLWTSVANASYLAATVHFIIENWELISFTLSCSEHSGASEAPDVLRELKKAWEAFGNTTEFLTEFLMAIVSDTAPVMAAFGRLMYEDYTVSHVYCAAHVLELTTGTTFISLFYHLLLILMNYTKGRVTQNRNQIPEK